MEIIIKDKKIELRYTVRAMFVYEKLANKVFQPTTLTELYLFFYSVILANDSSVDLTFDEFIGLCDEDPKLFSEFREWFLKELEKQAIYAEEANTSDEEGTKKKN